MGEGPIAMGRACAVCQRPDRAEIDRLLVSGELSNRRVASRCDVSESAVRRHREHIPAALVKAKEATDAAQADTLLDQVRDLNRRALAILDRAEKSGDLRAALQAIRETRGNVELLGRLSEQLIDRQRVELVGVVKVDDARGQLFAAIERLRPDEPERETD